MCSSRAECRAVSYIAVPQRRGATAWRRANGGAPQLNIPEAYAMQGLTQIAGSIRSTRRGRAGRRDIQCPSTERWRESGRAAIPLSSPGFRRTPRFTCRLDPASHLVQRFPSMFAPCLRNRGVACRDILESLVQNRAGRFHAISKSREQPTSALWCKGRAGPRARRFRLRSANN